MKNKLVDIILRLGIKILLLIFGITGLMLTFFSSGFMGNASGLLYFTIQSNITIMITMVIFLVLDIIKLVKHVDYVNNLLLKIKYVFTVAITITFLVFFLVLAPTLSDPKYLLSMGNLTVHFFVPILAIVDFYLFDGKIKLKKSDSLLALSMPLYYLVFALICSFSNVSFNGSPVPYFFLDYTQFGWFGFENGVGVFYWIILLLITISGLCFLMRYLITLRGKHLNQE